MVRKNDKVNVFFYCNPFITDALLIYNCVL